MTSLTSKLEAALLALVRREIPDVDEGGLSHVHVKGDESGTHHWCLDPAWLVGDEIDLTLIAQTLADAVEVRVDPPEAA